MLDEKLRTTVEALGKITSLKVNAYDTKNNSFEILNDGTVDAAVVSVMQKNRAKTGIYILKHTDAIYQFDDSRNLSSLVVNPPSSSTLLSFGPFFYGNKDPEPLISALEEHLGSKLSGKRINRILSSVPIKDDSFIESFRVIICNAFSLDVKNIEVVKESEIDNDSQRKALTLDQISNDRITEKRISEGYLFEQQIRQALLKADKARLQELLVPKNSDAMKKAVEMYGHNTKDREGANRLRYIKNVTVVLNTIFRLTAESSGLPPIYLHSISDKVAKSVEASNSQEEILGIISQMINTYCDAITRMNIENHSYRIIRVQKYIIANLTEDLSLEQLAEVAETSPQHLSRLFRKECGVTITDYIRKQRIGEAKWMLQSTDNPIYEIAEALGFSSQNYFCNVFQKETGMTPSDFKAQSEKLSNPV